MPDPAPLDALLDSVGALDSDRALRLVEQAAADLGTEAAVTDLLAAAQQEVGRRWEFGQWTISQEHAATAIVDSALSLLSARLAPTDGPRMAVVCAEGEWHVTPARMASLRLRGRGWQVMFLGASTPGPHLARTLDAMQPDVLAVSCTMPHNLPGARRTVEVAHEQGLPVLAGGAAFGTDGHRWRSIGADTGGTDLDLLEATGRTWLDTSVELRAGQPHHRDEVARLRQDHEQVVAAACADLLADHPWLTAAPQEHLDRTVEDLGWIVEYLTVALDVDDPSVLTDLLRWLEGLLTVRGVPRDALTAGLRAIEHHLDPSLTDARTCIQQAIRALDTTA